MHALDIFVVVSGIFSILATVPLIVLALRSLRDAGELRRLQVEVGELVVEVHEIQREIHRDQRRATSELAETKQTVERVAAATSRRRRLPRIRLELTHD